MKIVIISAKKHGEKNVEEMKGRKSAFNIIYVLYATINKHSILKTPFRGP